MLDLTLAGPGAINWLGASYRTILSPDKSGGTMSIIDSISPLNRGRPAYSSS
jgi:hypothetical protein